MKKYVGYLFIFIGIILGISYLIVQEHSISTISFFPIDETKAFQQAGTSVEAFQAKDKDGYVLRWNIESTSEVPLYLRQDISLLYEDGTFKGALSRWEENTDVINVQETFKGHSNRYYQAISFHHGEVHDKHNGIKSIQKMTSDILYVIDTEEGHFSRFQKPHNEEEEYWQKKLIQKVDKRLATDWTSLMDHYNINADDYDLIPLTDLYIYNDEPLSSLTMDQTDQVIGQLWEGIYKNYLIPATRLKSPNNPHVIPIILLDKDTSHLLVLFELNGKKNKLIQKIST